MRSCTPRGAHTDRDDGARANVGGFETVRGVSPLGAWAYTSWRPRELAAYVDHLWCFSGPTVHPRKRIFPNGCIELLVNLEAPYHELDAARPDHSGERLPVAWISGLADAAQVIAQPPRQHCLAARLRPTGAFALLARPVREVTGLSVDLYDLFGADVHPLIDRCALAPDAPEKLRVLGAWIAARIRRAEPVDRAVALATSELDRSGGSAAIASLAERAGVSRLRLRETFRDQVGVAPKLYARIVRFRRALALLQSSASPRLGELAFEARFYDQPHMNAEFRALGGVTPRQFLASRHPVGDGSTAADHST